MIYIKEVNYCTNKLPVILVIYFESDSKVCVDSLSGASAPHWRIAGLVSDIILSAISHPHWFFVWTKLCCTFTCWLVPEILFMEIIWCRFWAFLFFVSLFRGSEVRSILAVFLVVSVLLMIVFCYQKKKKKLPV